MFKTKRPGAGKKLVDAQNSEKENRLGDETAGIIWENTEIKVRQLSIHRPM